MVKPFATQADAYKELLGVTGDLLVNVSMPAKLEYLADMIEPVKDCAQKHGFDPNRINEIELALEEALVNVINYAYPEPGTAGNVEICFWQNDVKLFIISINDSGIYFDALEKKDPELTADISERDVGGLGIFLIKQFMDDVKYRRVQGHNILSFTVAKKGRTEPTLLCKKTH
jgi:serine/threonine-protein kinase RsbW